MDYVTIDIETANADIASICQIGAVRFSNGKLVSEWSSLVNPNDSFDSFNEGLHKISASQVNSSPNFSEAYTQLLTFIGDDICIFHTHFRRASLMKAINKHHLPHIENKWIDSAKIVRRVWNEFSYRGYGLHSVGKFLKIDFIRYNALEEARACGEILCIALDDSKTSISDWFDLVKKPITQGVSQGKYPEANPNGELFGHVIVFTGSLKITRNEAAVISASVGFEIGKSVTKKTDFLVVGDQDLMRVGETGKSSKQIRAEELINKGHELRIIIETDFQQLVGDFTTN